MTQGCDRMLLPSPRGNVQPIATDCSTLLPLLPAPRALGKQTPFHRTRDCNRLLRTAAKRTQAATQTYHTYAKGPSEADPPRPTLQRTTPHCGLGWTLPNAMICDGLLTTGATHARALVEPVQQTPQRTRNSLTTICGGCCSPSTAEHA